jgi:catechol 2,3-dioxygenase-like lactoylglutathione lyase family enzyme
MMVGAATVFVVTDIAKSAERYRDVLGFTVTFEYGTPTFYVCLCRDEVALHLLSASQTSRLSGNDAGVQWLESAICGIGGGIAMPTKLGSVGNFPTEDLVTMLEEMGIATGIDPEQAVALSREISALLGIDPQSHRANGATRKSVAELAGNNPHMRYS